MVVGDVMLDRYIWGNADRISPEAPIPVLTVTDHDERLGGAGSVVMILAAMDVDVVVATVSADDREGRRIRELLQRDRVDGGCIVSAPGRVTTVKERLLGRTQSRHPQQIIRVDRENCEELGDELSDQLLNAIERRLDEVSVVLVSDYNKGVCSDRFMQHLVAACRQRSIPVVADPARGVDYQRYRGCTSITPNRTEASLALGGVAVSTLAECREAAGKLLDFDIDSIVLTLDRDGIAWATRGEEVRLFPVQTQQVFDITGAGDAVLCGLGYGLAMGADWPDVIELANLAGGLEVQRLGVAPLTRNELLEELSEWRVSSRQKVVTANQLDQELEARRLAGQRIGMTNGCFDLLHPGHVASLEHARGQADCLVVGVNSDRSVEALKGRMPIIGEQDRAEMLASLMCVDFVVIFDDVSVAGLVERVAPDVLVKSAQYNTDQVVGHEIVEAKGGRIVLAPEKGSYSTTSLIARIQALANENGSKDN